MAKSKAKRDAVRKPPRASESLDRLIEWFAVNKPKYDGVIHVTLSDDTLRKFAKKKTDKDGAAIPGRWLYRDRELHQHHAVKPRTT